MEEDGYSAVIFGCRKPGTQEGSHGALVFTRAKDGTLHMALFDNAQRLVGKPESMIEMRTHYKRAVEEDGWIPMTQEDICLTSGT